jgi:hypothetical protein
MGDFRHFIFSLSVFYAMATYGEGASNNNQATAKLTGSRDGTGRRTLTGGTGSRSVHQISGKQLRLLFFVLFVFTSLLLRALRLQFDGQAAVQRLLRVVIVVGWGGDGGRRGGGGTRPAVVPALGDRSGSILSFSFVWNPVCGQKLLTCY